jgi:hypothetical protein
MTLYGTEAPDYTDGNLSIRPANAEELGYVDTPPPARHAADGGESLFDELLGLADEEVHNFQKFPVKFRKGGYVLEFDCIIGEPEIKRYRAASMGKRKKLEDADRSVGSAMILIEKNTGIYKQIDGELKKVLTPEGDELLLGHEKFLSAFGKGQLAQFAVRKFLGDAETNTIGDAVLKAAGWTEDLEPLDPTDA